VFKFLLNGDGSMSALAFHVCPSLSSPSVHDQQIALHATAEPPCTTVPASVRYRLLCSPPALEPPTLEMI